MRRRRQPVSPAPALLLAPGSCLTCTWTRAQFPIIHQIKPQGDSSIDWRTFPVTRQILDGSAIGLPAPYLLLATRMLTVLLPDHSHSFLPSFSDISQFYIHNG